MVNKVNEQWTRVSKMGKSKKENVEENDVEENGTKEIKWDQLVSQVERIANPLASKKLTKRLYKIIKKG